MRLPDRCAPGAGLSGAAAGSPQRAAAGESRITAVLTSMAVSSAPGQPGDGVPGCIYLIHFRERYRHAGHYTGWTSDLDSRLAEHAAGRGARLLAVVAAAGIGWELAGVWPGTRNQERALKRRGGAGRRCPLCYSPDLHAALAGVAAGRVAWRRGADPGLAWADGGGELPSPGVLAALRQADRAGLLTPLPRLCHPAHVPCPCPAVPMRLSPRGRGRLRALDATRLAVAP